MRKNILFAIKTYGEANTVSLQLEQSLRFYENFNMGTFQVVHTTEEIVKELGNVNNNIDVLLCFEELDSGPIGKGTVSSITKRFPMVQMILIMDNAKEASMKVNNLYEIEYYFGVFVRDSSAKVLSQIINNGRTKMEAYDYYKLDEYTKKANPVMQPAMTPQLPGMGITTEPYGTQQAQATYATSQVPTSNEFKEPYHGFERLSENPEGQESYKQKVPNYHYNTPEPAYQESASTFSKSEETYEKAEASFRESDTTSNYMPKSPTQYMNTPETQESSREHMMQENTYREERKREEQEQLSMMGREPATEERFASRNMSEIFQAPATQYATAAKYSEGMVVNAMTNDILIIAVSNRDFPVNKVGQKVLLTIL